MCKQSFLSQQAVRSLPLRDASTMMVKVDDGEEQAGQFPTRSLGGGVVELTPASTIRSDGQIVGLMPASTRMA